MASNFSFKRLVKSTHVLELCALGLAPILWLVTVAGWQVKQIAIALGVMCLSFLFLKMGQSWRNAPLKEAVSQIQSNRDSYVQGQSEILFSDELRFNPAIVPLVEELRVTIDEALGYRGMVKDMLASLFQQNATIYKAITDDPDQSPEHIKQMELIQSEFARMQHVFTITIASAKEAVEVASNAEEEGSKGKVIISEAMGNIMTLTDAINIAGETVSSLGKDSESIGQMLQVIKGVAAQTNLLALNAAIEAARAGDQGRGFAVVADEVRALANKTQSYTAEIDGVVTKLLSHVEEASQVIQQSVALASESDSLIESVVVAYSELVGSLNTLSKVGGVLDSVTDQDEQDTTRAIEAVDQLLSGEQASSNSKEQILAACEQMGYLAHELEEKMHLN